MKKIYFTNEEKKKAKQRWNRIYYLKNKEILKKKRLEKLNKKNNISVRSK